MEVKGLGNIWWQGVLPVQWRDGGSSSQLLLLVHLGPELGDSGPLRKNVADH